jgi:hypothetical protein
VSWFSRKPPPPEIPPYKPVEPSEIKSLPKPKDEGIVVQEETWPAGDEVEAMSRTGQFKAWVKTKLTGEGK